MTTPRQHRRMMSDDDTSWFVEELDNESWLPRGSQKGDNKFTHRYASPNEKSPIVGLYKRPGGTKHIKLRRLPDSMEELYLYVKEIYDHNADIGTTMGAMPVRVDSKDEYKIRKGWRLVYKQCNEHSLPKLRIALEARSRDRMKGTRLPPRKVRVRK